MAELDEVLREFNADVERAEHLLALVKVFKEFGASAPEAVDGRDPWPAALKLHEESRSRRTDLPIVSGSLQLYLAGRFEFCMRQIVEATAEALAARASKFSELPEKLRSELKAKALDVAKNPRRFGFGEAYSESLLIELSETLRANTRPVPIAANIISITESNLKDRTLAEVFNRVGMTDYWKDVGKQASMKLLLERGNDGDSTVAAQAKLNSIMDERNQVAHPTATTVFPDPDQVLSSAKFLRVLAATTVELTKVYLASRNT